MTGRRPARTGSNVVRVGSYNQALVLDAIRRRGSISRVEIADLTGLAPQTVTNISRRLIDDGFIVEAGKVATSLGKPRTALQPRSGSYHAVGVLFDPDASSVVLLDLAGGVRARGSFAHSYSEDPRDVIAAIADRIDGLLAQAGVDRSRVLGVGIGSPGPIDFDRGTLRDPPNLPRWHGVPLRELLEDAVGLPVVLDKDVVAAAVAESWYGSGERRDTTAVVYVGTGIGVGVCLDGEVFRGSSGNAGEIGHVIVDPDGPECHCGRRGCVGVVSAPSALAKELGVPAIGADDAMRLLVERAAQDPDAAELLQRAARGLVRLSANVARLYDVNRIIFGGPMWPHFAGVLDDDSLRGLGEALTERLHHRVSCRASTLTGDLGAVGAACLVFDNLLSPGRSQLFLRTGD